MDQNSQDRTSRAEQPGQEAKTEHPGQLSWYWTDRTGRSEHGDKDRIASQRGQNSWGQECWDRSRGPAAGTEQSERTGTIKQPGY